MSDAESQCIDITEQLCSFGRPNYDAVAKTLAHRCGPCHAPGTEIEYIPLNSATALLRQRENLVAMVRDCVLPPTRQSQLLLEERRELLDWLVCPPDR